MRMVNFFSLTGAALLLAVLLPCPARANQLVIGKPAPAVEMQTLDGQHIDTRALKGDVVLVTFWASWCSPCREEMPLLAAYAKAHAGLRVLALSLDDEEDIATVRKLAAPFPFPAGLLSQARLPGYGRIWRIPVSFVIDREGRLVDNGWNDDEPMWTQERLEKVVTPLLGR